jgi:chlorobactene glucosyltransferase
MIAELPWAYIALAAAPWLAVPVVILWRLHGSPSLANYSPAVPDDASLVSVVVPARDESRNIEDSLHSILASTWPSLEVIVVDDHSSDGTGEMARSIAAADPRVHVISNPDLPDGWMGKQWACHNGQLAATGKYLLFTDADTRHEPELLARSMTAMRKRRADLLTVVGAQTMLTFWEKLIQPHVLGILAARFGNTERANESKDPLDKIANGQFLFMRTDTYDRTGGHEAVRTHVAEDLRLAQEWTRLGFSVQLVEGFDYMHTRMYEGFREIWRGWGKNVWAAGRDTVEAGPVVMALIRVVGPLVPLWEVLPALAIVLAIAGFVPAAVGAWGAVAYVFGTLFWIVIHREFRAPLAYAFLNPLAAAVLVGLFSSAAWRGDRVEWKGRAYISR